MYRYARGVTCIYGGLKSPTSCKFKWKSTIFPIICTNFNVVTIFELFICYIITCIFYFCAMFIYLQIVRNICISSLSFLFSLLVVREILPTIKHVNKYNFRIKLIMVKTSIGITTIRHVNWSSTKLCDFLSIMKCIIADRSNAAVWLIDILNAFCSINHRLCGICNWQKSYFVSL